MKLELPIAIALLAAGGWLFVSGPNNRSSLHKQTAKDSRSALHEQSADIDPDQANISRPDFVNDALIQTVAYAAAIEPPIPINNSAALLQAIGSSLRNSPPFQMDFQTELRLSDRASIIVGRYSQAGQGSLKTKIELQLSATARLTKLCDGRFLYTLAEQGELQTLEFIDLRKIQETRLASGMAQPDNPTSWIATGGLASLFDNLAVAFEFQPAEVSEVDGVSLTTITGRWQTKHLIELLNKTLSPEALSPELMWDQVPTQIPHSVRIELEHVVGFGWVPRQISFTRFSGNSTASTKIPLANFQFSSLQGLPEDSDRLFQLETEELESIDATDLYVQQVRDFGAARQANLNSASAPLQR